MNINEIKDLIKAVSESDVDMLKYREGDADLVIGKKAGLSELAEYSQAIPVSPAVHLEAPSPEAARTENAVTEPKSDETVTLQTEAAPSGRTVNSPLVGTAYVSDKEGGDPLVNVGDTVKVGQVIAIVEAMKLMNEITSDADGVVREILFKDGDAVEYDQPLFVIG